MAYQSGGTRSQLLPKMGSKILSAKYEDYFKVSLFIINLRFDTEETIQSDRLIMANYNACFC